MEFISDLFTPTNLSVVILAILTMLAAIAVKHQKMIEEFKDVVKAWGDGKAPDSPGGSDLTHEERDRLRQESAEAGKLVVAKYSNDIYEWIGWIMRKIIPWSDNPKT